jgi:AcrR family transcriptional regulator
MKRARTELSKENRKQFILDCAEELIIKEGLQKLSLSKVSKKSKLAIGTIYIYFKSKEEIIASLTVKSRHILLEKFIENTSEVENSLAKIESILLSFYSFYKEKPFYNQLVTFYESNSGLQETPELIDASYKITQLVVDIVKMGKAKKEIRKDIDELSFSFMLWGTAIGIIQLIEIKSVVLENTLKIDEFEFYKNYISLIINSLKTN